MRAPLEHPANGRTTTNRVAPNSSTIRRRARAPPTHLLRTSHMATCISIDGGYRYRPVPALTAKRPLSLYINIFREFPDIPGSHQQQ
jgi:hypothetical protein